jgi:hypothetical protein
MILREFNEAGTQAFKRFLSQCRENPDTPVPSRLLEEPSATAVVSPECEVAFRHFAMRREAADYLTSALDALPQSLVASSSGIWTWLSLFFFDELCPLKDGKRAITNDYRYIFEPNNPRHFYRHLLFIAWQVKRLAPQHNRLLLDVPFGRLDQVTVEVMKRLYLTRVPCIFEVLDRLYWDAGRGRARPGIVTQEIVRPGDLRHRLPIRMRQLERTYDLMSLSADQLLDLLGDEFKSTSASGSAKPAASAAAG